jgi:choline transporter-like protein 2/4/5
MNAMRLITVNIIGDILITLGKIAVAAGCGLIAFGMTELPYYTNKTQYPETTLSSPIFPVALSILIGFVCAEIFFSVYEMAIDTIFLAFCEDCDKHDGNPKWAPPILMEAMGQKPGHQVSPPPPPPKMPVKGGKVHPTTR